MDIPLPPKSGDFTTLNNFYELSLSRTHTRIHTPFTPLRPLHPPPLSPPPLHTPLPPPKLVKFRFALFGKCVGLYANEQSDYGRCGLSIFSTRIGLGGGGVGVGGMRMWVWWEDREETL